MPETTPDKKGGRTVADALRKSLRILAIATAVLYLALILGGIKVYLDARATTNALCDLREDLTRRVVVQVEFLRQNPEGTSGISAKTIIDSISNTQRSILALRDLSCDNEIPEASLDPPPATP